MIFFFGLASIALFFLGLGIVTITSSKSVGGFASASQSNTVTDVTGIQASPTVPAAQPAVLTTRTNNTAGSLTMTNSSHGITTGARVDLYWAGGRCYGATVGTVSGTTVPIATVSGGDNLPIATTAITVGKATVADFPFTGDNLTALVLNNFQGSQNAYFVVNDGSSDNYAVYLVGGSFVSWLSGVDIGVNPLAGDTPTRVYISHDSVGGSVSTMNANALVH